MHNSSNTHNLLRITCTSDEFARTTVRQMRGGDIIIVPSARVRTRVYDDLVRNGVVLLPTMYTQSTFLHWLAVRMKVPILPEADILCATLFKRVSSVQSTYEQYVRWRQEGQSLQRIYEQANEPSATQSMKKLGETLQRYTSIKGAWVDTADLTEHLVQHIPNSGLLPHNVLVFDTHGITQADVRVFSALANIGWHIAISFASFCEENTVAAQRTRNDAISLVSQGWNRTEERTPHTVTIVPNSSHSLRSAVYDAVARVKYCVLKEGVDPADICVVIPDGSSLRKPFIELCLAAHLPIVYSETVPFTRTEVVATIHAVSQLILHNWRRRDFERVIRIKSVVENQGVINQVLLKMYEKKQIGGNGATALKENIRNIVPNALQSVLENVFQLDISTTQELYAAQFITWLTSLLEIIRTTSNEDHIRDLEYCAEGYQKLEEHTHSPSQVFEKHIQQFFSMLAERSVYTTMQHDGGVHVLSATQLRGNSYNVVYVLGATEGVFPQAHDDELDALLVEGLTESKQHQALQDIVNVCKEGATIYWHWNRNDENGRTTPSSFLKLLQNIGSTTEYSEEQVAAQVLFLPETQQPLETLREIYTAKQRGGVYPEQQSTENFLVAIRARELSASRLDAIAECPFKFFGERVLYLGETSTYDFSQTSLERGLEFHEILHEFYSGLQSFSGTVVSVDDILKRRVILDAAKFEEYYAMLENIYRNRRVQNQTSWVYSSREDMMMLGTPERAGLLRVWLTRELRDQQETEFAPTLLEFREHLELPEAIAGQTERMVMQIDRVDTRYYDGVIHAIIIDYKSTISGFKSTTQLIEGRATQMPLYVVGLQQWFNERQIPAIVTQAHYIALGKHLLDGNLGKISRKGLRSDFMPSGSKKTNKQYSTAIDEAKDLVSQMGVLVQRIRKANFAVEPSDDACKYCILPNLCRKHHWGIIDEKTNLGTTSVDMPTI